MTFAFELEVQLNQGICILFFDLNYTKSGLCRREKKIFTDQHEQIIRIQ